MPSTREKARKKLASAKPESVICSRGRPKDRAPFPKIDPEHYLRQIKSVNPETPDEPVKYTLSMCGWHKQRKATPSKAFEGCPYPDGTVEQNELVTVDDFNTEKPGRLLFRASFKEKLDGNREFSWIDANILVTLRPSWIWLDFIRGIYVHNRSMGPNLFKRLQQQLGEEEASKIITDFIVDNVNLYMTTRDRLMRIEAARKSKQSKALNESMMTSETNKSS